MKYEEFKEKMMEAIVNAFSDCTVEQRPITKNNGLQLDGVILQKPGLRIAPTVYLNYMYEDFQRGASVEEITERLQKVLAKELPVGVPTLTREAAEKNLYAVVVNAAANEELLKETPHRRIEDLAVIPRFHVASEAGNASFRVTNGVLQDLKMTKEEVLDIAIGNSAKEEYTCRSMATVLREMMGAELAPEMEEEMFASAPQLYVLTNTSKVQGATALACKKVLAEAGEKVGEDFFILPSSIHELLLVPASAGMQLSDLQAMVHEVNSTEVAPDEMLSDSVYHYSVQSKKLEIAREDIRRKLEELVEEKSESKGRACRV